MNTGTKRIILGIIIVLALCLIAPGVILTSCLGRGISSDEELLEEKIHVIYFNDDNSYIELENYYYDAENKNTYFEFLPLSLKMMKEKNFGHIDFFKTYMKISFNNQYDPKNIYKLSTKEREFLIEILNKGAAGGDSHCDSVLKIVSDIKLIKDQASEQ